MSAHEERETSITIKTIGLLMEYESALTSIAAFNDAGGNDTLEKTGSYSAFDEPGSVRLAREALKRGSAIANRPPQ